MTQHETPDQQEPEEGSGDAASETPRGSSKAPAGDPDTNLLMADILVRGASELFSKRVEQRVGKNAPTKNDENLTKLNGKTLLTTLGLYGASKLARRSVGGLMVVAGGLVAKTLYDRGKAKQLREQRENAQADSAPPATGEE